MVNTSLFNHGSQPGSAKKRESKALSKISRQSSSRRKPSKTNRTRKSQCQKEQLWQVYKDLDGKIPSRELITELSEELNLKENQIYKWFWDTKKKVEEDNLLAE